LPEIHQVTFVEFEDPRDAEDAVRGLDGTRICGVRVRVEMSSNRPRSGRDGRGVLIAEEVVVAAVDITEVLHAIMIGIMTDHDRVHQNVVLRLQGHVPGVTRQDNVARHIPKIKVKTMIIQVQSIEL